MDMLLTAKAALAALIASSALPSGPGAGLFDDAPPQREGRMGQARDGRQAGSERAREGMQGDRLRQGADARMGQDRGRASMDRRVTDRRADRGLAVQLVSLKVVESQELFGDEARLQIGGRDLVSFAGLADGETRSLAFIKPLKLDGSLEMSLWEDDPDLLGLMGDDLLGSEELHDMAGGTYMTTFRGSGGVYELTFDIDERQPEQRLVADHSGGRSDRARGSERSRDAGPDRRSSYDAAARGGQRGGDAGRQRPANTY